MRTKMKVNRISAFQLNEIVANPTVASYCVVPACFFAPKTEYNFPKINPEKNFKSQNIL